MKKKIKSGISTIHWFIHPRPRDLKIVLTKSSTVTYIPMWEGVLENKSKKNLWESQFPFLQFCL